MKSVIVEYEKGLPTEVHEVRNFKDENSFEAFLSFCLANKEKTEKAEMERKAKKEEIENAKKCKRCAWIARLWLEHELDSGSHEMSESEYEAFLDNFNMGEMIELEGDLSAVADDVWDCVKYHFPQCVADGLGRRMPN